MAPLAAAMEEPPVHSISDADTVAVFINELAETFNIPRNQVAELICMNRSYAIKSP